MFGGRFLSFYIGQSSCLYFFLFSFVLDRFSSVIFCQYIFCSISLGSGAAAFGWEIRSHSYILATSKGWSFSAFSYLEWHNS